MHGSVGIGPQSLLCGGGLGSSGSSLRHSADEAFTERLCATGNFILGAFVPSRQLNFGPRKFVALTCVFPQLFRISSRAKFAPP
jgi:hypothetical protein